MAEEQMTQQGVSVKFTGKVIAKGSGVQGLSSGELTFTVEDGKITYGVGQVGEETTITSDVSFDKVEKSGLKVDETGKLYGDSKGDVESVSFELVGQTSGEDFYGNQFKVTITGTFDAVENFPKKDGDITDDDTTTEGIHVVQVTIEKI